MENAKGGGLTKTCFLNLLTKKLNISDEHIHENQHIVFIMHFSEVLREDIEFLLVDHRYTSSYGITKDRYTFVTIVDRETTTTIRSLLKPLDSPTWMFLLLSIFLLLLFAKYVSANAFDMTVLFNIIDQGQPMHMTISSASGLLFFCWTVVILTVSNSYKGNVFELIVNPTYPMAPKHVDEISHFDYQILSFSAQPERNWIPVVRTQISELLAEFDKNETELPNADIYLEEKLIWAYCVKWSNYAYLLLKERRTTNELKNKNTVDVSVRVPFIFLDSMHRVRLLQQIAQLTSGQMIKKGNELGYFST